MTAISVQHFGKMLVEAGVLTEERVNKTSRIVIDCDTQNGAVIVYVQEFGDGKALAKLTPMLKGMIPNGD